MFIIWRVRRRLIFFTVCNVLLKGDFTARTWRTFGLHSVEFFAIVLFGLRWTNPGEVSMFMFKPRKSSKLGCRKSSCTGADFLPSTSFEKSLFVSSSCFHAETADAAKRFKLKKKVSHESFYAAVKEPTNVLSKILYMIPKQNRKTKQNGNIVL